MMDKKGISTLIIIAISSVLFLAVGALIAADVPEQIKIENQGYKSDKKGPVEFHHKKHSTDYNIACIDCHHVYDGGNNVWKEGDPVKKCIECHDPEKSGDTMKLQNAFHKNCKDCHKEISKEGKEAPYKKCTDCHGKKG